MRSRMRSRWGESLGAWAATVQSASMSSKPWERANSITRASSTRESAPS